MGNVHLWGRERTFIDAWLVGQRLKHQWPCGAMNELAELLISTKGTGVQFGLRPINDRNDLLTTIVENEDIIVTDESHRTILGEVAKQLFSLPPDAIMPIDLAN